MQYFRFVNIYCTLYARHERWLADRGLPDREHSGAVPAEPADVVSEQDHRHLQRLPDQVLREGRFGAARGLPGGRESAELLQDVRLLEAGGHFRAGGADREVHAAAVGPRGVERLAGDPGEDGADARPEGAAGPPRAAVQPVREQPGRAQAPQLPGGREEVRGRAGQARQALQRGHRQVLRHLHPLQEPGGARRRVQAAGRALQGRPEEQERPAVLRAADRLHRNPVQEQAARTHYARSRSSSPSSPSASSSRRSSSRTSWTGPTATRRRRSTTPS